MLFRSLTGELNGKVLVHLDPQLNSFMLEVNDCIDQYLASMNVEYNIHFMKTWYAISGEDCSVPNHCHDPAHISWVYYIQTPGDPIVFHKKNSNEWFGDAFKFSNHYTYTNMEGYAINPKAERLVIFPGSLEHYTTAEPRKHRRISLAGDVILTLKDRTNSESGLLSPQFWKHF